MSLNKSIVMGRLTKDVEMRHTQTGTAVASFTLAVDRDFKAKDGTKETDWIDVVAWRNTAEFVGKYFSKGRMAIVEGRLQTRNYEDKNGNKRKVVELMADNVYFGDSKSENKNADPLDTFVERMDQFSEVDDDDTLPF